MLGAGGRGEARGGRPEGGCAWAAKTVRRPPPQPARPRYTNDGAPRRTRNDTGRSTGRSGRQNAATRRHMRREVRVTVQGPVKKPQPDGMAHIGGGRGRCIVSATTASLAARVASAQVAGGNIPNPVVKVTEMTLFPQAIMSVFRCAPSPSPCRTPAADERRRQCPCPVAGAWDGRVLPAICPEAPCTHRSPRPATPSHKACGASPAPAWEGRQGAEAASRESLERGGGPPSPPPHCTDSTPKAFPYPKTSPQPHSQPPETASLNRLHIPRERSATARGLSPMAPLPF